MDESESDKKMQVLMDMVYDQSVHFDLEKFMISGKVVDRQDVKVRDSAQKKQDLEYLEKLWDGGNGGGDFPPDDGFGGGGGDDG